MSWIYVNGQVGEMQDPDRAFTYHLECFLIMDAISNFLQTLTTMELKVRSNIAWCWFGKLAMLTHLLIYFDDRRPLILQYFAVSVWLTFVQSIVMVKLISRYQSQNSVLDWIKVFITL